MPLLCHKDTQLLKVGIETRHPGPGPLCSLNRVPISFPELRQNPGVLASLNHKDTSLHGLEPELGVSGSSYNIKYLPMKMALLDGGLVNTLGGRGSF